MVGCEAAAGCTAAAWAKDADVVLVVSAMGGGVNDADGALVTEASDSTNSFRPFGMIVRATVAAGGEAQSRPSACARARL